MEALGSCSAKLSEPSHRERTGGLPGTEQLLINTAAARAERMTSISSVRREIHATLGPSPSQEGPSKHPASNTAPFLTAEPPAVVTGSFLVGPVSNSSTLPCLPLPTLFNQEPASGRMRLEETNQMPSMLGGLERVGFLPLGRWIRN